MSENYEEFDKKAQEWYNSNKDANGTVRIDTRNLKPLYDSQCKHEWYLDAEDADSTWANVWKCKKPECPVGQLTSK